VPSEILALRNTWDDPEAYDQQAQELARKFVENFQQFTAASAEIIAAGPVPN
jgi:phosphoenolpyruvate carboxykinase (ATP)